MSHAVYGHRVVYDYRDEVPWHKLANPVDFDKLTVVEATQAAKGDYKVHFAQPAGYTLPDGTNVMMSDISEETQRNALAILRAPSYEDTQWAVLGSATEKFVVLDNMEIAAGIEPLVKWGRLTTIGVLNNGARIFWCFQGGEWDILLPNGKKDHNQLYLCIKDTKLPDEALSFDLSYVRTVCRNTWDASLSSAALVLPIAHTGKAKEIFNWVVKGLDDVAKLDQEAKNQAQWMAQTEMPKKAFNRLLAHTFPTPRLTKIATALKLDQITTVDDFATMADDIKDYLDKSEETFSYNEQRMANLRAAAEDAYKTEIMEDGSHGTAWGAYQAVTNAVDHLVTTETRHTQTKKAIISNLFGERRSWKREAFKFCTSPKEFEWA